MSCGTTTCKSSTSFSPARQPLRRVVVWSMSNLRKSFRLISGTCERRRQRRKLRELEDRMLNDIGVSREDAVREARKPFWR